MIISKDYGPQLDPADGTCGEIKLVKRWVLIYSDDGHPALWGPRQGRGTNATKAEAQRKAKVFIANNPPGKVPADLRAAPWWCWPGHFDPACAVPDEDTKHTTQ